MIMAGKRHIDILENWENSVLYILGLSYIQNDFNQG